MISNLRGRVYEDRLRGVGLTLLVERRRRGHDHHVWSDVREGQGGQHLVV